MPTNKHASLRYRVLDKCFSNRGRRRWSIQALVEEVSRCLEEDFGSNASVSKRTIEGDIHIMRKEKPLGFNAPIICQDGFYFYGDPGFSIEKNSLGQEELDMLRGAVGLLRQMPGLPQLPALEMLLKRVDGHNAVHVLSSSWIQFETNPAVQGLEWLGTIYKAIAEQQVLAFDYHPFTEAPLEIILHPYLLKEWHNRWYIFGRNVQGEIWNLGLDRIHGISIQEHIEYQLNDLFDPETWFDDIVGVSKPEGAAVTEVQFETTYLSSRYLETRPIHKSQQLIRSNPNQYTFSIQVKINHELINELVRYGNDLKVLKPLDLAKTIQARLTLDPNV